MKIEYNGAGFAGWQRQKDQPSVQQSIEEALGQLLPGEHRIAGAGRTDTGVHATAQVAHVDLNKAFAPERVQGALNYHLRGHGISIVACAEVTEDFHARFSAHERRYLFRILSRRSPSVFDRGQVWQIGHKLDVQAMQEGANHLIGTHDFTTFRSVMCQAQSPVKTLDALEISAHQAAFGTEYHFRLRARSFLHNQVRSFVGTLERVGAGRWHPDRVKTALEAADRAACGPVSPPQGLYLSHVGYDPDPFAQA